MTLIRRRTVRLPAKEKAASGRRADKLLPYILAQPGFRGITLPQSTRLFHGTEARRDFTVLDQLSWVSPAIEDAWVYATDRGHGGQSRVLEFAAVRDLVLLEIRPPANIDKLGALLGGAFIPPEVADALCAALPSLDGWCDTTWPLKGSDILLCAPDTVLQLTLIHHQVSLTELEAWEAWDSLGAQDAQVAHMMGLMRAARGWPDGALPPLLVYPAHPREDLRWSDKPFVLLDGNHRYMAASLSGLSHAPTMMIPHARAHALLENLGLQEGEAQMLGEQR